MFRVRFWIVDQQPTALHAESMPRLKRSSDLAKVAHNTPASRDRAVDVARLTALVVVMFGHCALLLATIDSGGLRIGNLLGAIPALAPITWLVQVMPLFFLAGGAAGAYGWHDATPWGPGCSPVHSDCADPRSGTSQRG